MFFALTDSIYVEDHFSSASCVSLSKVVSFFAVELLLPRKLTENPMANPMTSIVIVDITILFFDNAILEYVHMNKFK